jgi:hypothetical protein
MEVLSSTSSVFAVLSLTIQLGDSVKKLCEFFQSIEEAPQYIVSIFNDLSIISSIAESIRREAETPGPHTRTLDTSIRALSQCCDKAEQLKSLVSKYELVTYSSDRSKRVWPACKVAWKANAIRKSSDAFRDAKMTLMLARLESFRYTSFLSYVRSPC